MATQESEYFQLARHWSDDYYLAAVTASRRWRLVCLGVLLPALFLCLLAIVFLVPMQHLQPLLINHYQDGVVTVTPIKQSEAPKNQAEVSSDIVRYIIDRESYSVYSYRTNYQLIHLLSSASVFDDYIQQLHLKAHHYRTVMINSVLYLDRESLFKKPHTALPHHNLVQVNFVVVDHNVASGAVQQIPLTALVSWTYRGMPSDPTAAWRNWNGFTVLSYEVQPRV